ncbi:ABC transporter ATP-binding protein [Bifidobacterium animalis subsp. animalis]|nr:ABC transporter ATP-binding protein [Bifidobacterium animalis subsp. animalis]
MTAASVPNRGDSHVIDVRDMCFRYAHGSNQVLNNISLTVDAGEMLCLLGPSGGGKTTLVDTIMGVQVPQSGTVSVFGEQAPYRNARRRVGFMPQETALYEDISAQDNLRFFGELFGMHGNALLARMDELFALTDLRNDRGKLVADYSGGMKRRLSLAVALVQRPDLLVLDEPTVGLDPEQRLFIWRHLRELSDRGVAILMTTHVMDEAQRCERIAMIRRGSVIADGSPEEICRRTHAADLEEAFLTLERHRGEAARQKEERHA